ncbi:MAG: carbon-nitrogen hydrolase [Gammaproteobacteria bacterium]|nr:carbon-nitrogen hydrolase [Gammaproteobacteria bacterium]
MFKKPFMLGLIQMRMTDDPKKNIDHACELLAKAAKQGAQMVCLPELFSSKYLCQKEDHELFGLAEPVPGPTSAILADVAKQHKIVIVGSIFERRAAGIYHNTAVVFDVDGSIAGTYRKMHIPDDPLYYEKFYFTPGDLGFQAMDTKVGKIGTLICWDQWYPEAARLTAMQGANVICYPTAIGWHPKEKEEFGASQADAWETIQRGHAIANGTYVVVCNRTGHEGDKEGGLEFWGNSFIADPFGRILAKASHDKEEILTAICDPALQESTRCFWPFFRDRRIDAYGDITKRFGK